MNAKNELLDKIKNLSEINCAFIEVDNTAQMVYDLMNGITKDRFALTSVPNENLLPQFKVILPLSYSEEEYKKFLNELNFDYIEGHGAQFITGTVWLKDNTWLARREYDGMEWWEHVVIPKIPHECLKYGSEGLI